MRLLHDRRGAIALMVGIMAPGLIAFVGMTTDAGFWILGQTRLQVAADAAAMGTGFLLTSTAFKGQTAAAQQTTAQAVALAEANGAMTKMMGTLTTPVTVTIASDYTTATITLTSQATSLFGGVMGVSPPLMRATATASLKSAAGGTCVLALATSGNAILVDNAGVINVPNCTVASKANIYLNSGTIIGSSIIAAGTVTKSNSGSNTMTPATATQNSTSVPSDPYAGKTAPTPGTCSSDSATKYSAYGTYTVSPTTWCTSMTIGGNSSTITFNPGVYILNNADLTFNNASITSAAGVTFVLAGTKPGNFSWTNNSTTSSNAITAPTTGTTAGMVVWQACNSSGTQTTTFAGGSTLSITGAIYAPCSALDMSNAAKIIAPAYATATLIAKTIALHGSAAFQYTTIPLLTQ